MKILIIAYHFYPDVNPRAFRAFELTKQFAKEGHTVTVFLPAKGYDYTEVCKKYNFSVELIGHHKTLAPPSSEANTSQSMLKKTGKKLFKTIAYCFMAFGVFTKFYFYALYKKLINYNEYQDMIISIATPFDTHMAMALAVKKNTHLRDTAIKVADYGDPLYKNPAFPNCPLYFWIDKYIASQFDYITTPTEKALSIFSNFKKRENIKIIPQGFDFSETKIAKYQINNVSTFAYAGMLYKEIRNPKSLLDFLLKLHTDGIDFKFIIYTKTENHNIMQMLESYQNILGSKLIVQEMISRHDVIFELSKMDFLINLENLSSSQVPSKLIDYALAKRPIYSFSQVDFSEDTFMNFFRGDYSKEKKIDLDDFNIENVSKQFTDLMLQENTE